MKTTYFLLYDGNPNSGVTKKVISQVSLLFQLGLDIKLVMVGVGDIHYSSHDFLTIHNLMAFPKWNFLGRIKRTITINKIFSNIITSSGSQDVVYYRYSSSIPFYYPLNYLKRYRICKIVTEHQSIELDEYKMSRIYFGYLCELFFGGILKKQSDAIVGVTNEITNHNLMFSGDLHKPHITIGNGFNIKSVPLKQNSSNNTDLQLRLLSVTQVRRWHGLDRLLIGLATYKGNINVTLHIVGDGSELPHLIKLINKLNIQDRVILHGFQYGESLDALFNHCHIAVGSLGIHRKGLSQTSELKAREYCARGIPYIIACSDPDFPDDFPYILRLPADDSPIDIDRVSIFASRVKQEPDHPQKMRQYAIENLDWTIKMKKLKMFLEELITEDNP